MSEVAKIKLHYFKFKKKNENDEELKFVFNNLIKPKNKDFKSESKTN
jgi:hypothetical protein